KHSCTQLLEAAHFSSSCDQLLGAGPMKGRSNRKTTQDLEAGSAGTWPLAASIWPLSAAGEGRCQAPSAERQRLRLRYFLRDNLPRTLPAKSSDRPSADFTREYASTAFLSSHMSERRAAPSPGRAR